MEKLGTITIIISIIIAIWKIIEKFIEQKVKKTPNKIDDFIYIIIKYLIPVVEKEFSNLGEETKKQIVKNQLKTELKKFEIETNQNKIDDSVNKTWNELKPKDFKINVKYNVGD